MAFMDSGDCLVGRGRSVERDDKSLFWFVGFLVDVLSQVLDCEHFQRYLDLSEGAKAQKWPSTPVHCRASTGEAFVARTLLKGRKKRRKKNGLKVSEHGCPLLVEN